MSRNFLGAPLAAVLGAAMAAVTLPTAAVAQEAAPQTSEQAQDFSETQLESFAVAFLEVREIGQSYQDRLQAAGSVEERREVEVEAATEMVQAVEATEGLSIGEYNAILAAAQADPELAARIQERISEQADAPGQ